MLCLRSYLIYIIRETCTKQINARARTLPLTLLRRKIRTTALRNTRTLTRSLIHSLTGSLVRPPTNIHVVRATGPFFLLARVSPNLYGRRKITDSEKREKNQKEETRAARSNAFHSRFTRSITSHERLHGGRE